MNANYSIQEVKDFINKIILYPKIYGYQAILDLESNSRNNLEFCFQHEIPSINLTPDIEYCIFCEKSVHSKLIFKQPGFWKEPFVYGSNAIGLN
jgi:hypothetical protein